MDFESPRGAADVGTKDIRRRGFMHSRRRWAVAPELDELVPTIRSRPAQREHGRLPEQKEID